MADENTNGLTEQEETGAATETQEQGAVQERQAVTLGQLRKLAHSAAGNISELGELLSLLGVFFGECKTAADVAEKAVVCPAFEKVAGAKIIVKFTTANTADNATLNVNNTGAALVTYQGAAIGKSQLSAGKLRLFMFDGTNYEFVGDTNTTHNTFSGATAEANGAKGLVPQPKIGDQKKYLMGNATWGDLPILRGASDSVGGSAGIVPAPIAGEEEYFLKGNGSWGIPAGSGSGAAGNYRQITKMNITASANNPQEVSVPLPKSTSFLYSPPNVLLFVPGSTNIVATACDFNNGDAEDFQFANKYVTFDGQMHLTTEYSLDMGEAVTLGAGYLYTGETVNLSEYKKTESVVASVGQAVGIALVSSGGGSGTWARFVENSAAILLSGGAAYDASGNQLAASWAALSAAEKIALFESANILDALPENQHLTHSIAMGTPTALGNGYLSTSDEIDMSDYETVASVEVGNGSVVGIALISSGGGSGTWARITESSTAILISSEGAAYDFAGNELAANWANLTDTEKVTAIGSATGDSPLTTMETLGTFRFAVYSENSGTSTCVINETKILASFQVAVFTMDESTPSCIMTAVPKDQLVVPDGLITLVDYDAINSVTMTQSASGNAAVRFAVTPDRETYYVYDPTEGEWASIPATAAGVLEDGMTSSEIAAVPAEAWAALTATSEAVGFAYALSMTDSAETLYVDAVTLNVDMKGAWRAAIYGDEYAYDYPNNVSMRFTLYESGNWKINYDAGA